MKSELASNFRQPKNVKDHPADPPPSRLCWPTWCHHFFFQLSDFPLAAITRVEPSTISVQGSPITVVGTGFSNSPLDPSEVFVGGAPCPLLNYLITQSKLPVSPPFLNKIFFFWQIPLFVWCRRRGLLVSPLLLLMSGKRVNGQFAPVSAA